MSEHPTVLLRFTIILIHNEMKQTEKRTLKIYCKPVT